MTEDTKKIKIKEYIYLVKTRGDPRSTDVIFKDKKKAIFWISHSEENEKNYWKDYYNDHYDQLKDEYPDFNSYWENGKIDKCKYFIETYLLDDYFW